jgi:hypothetical protein
MWFSFFVIFSRSRGLLNSYSHSTYNENNHTVYIYRYYSSTKQTSFEPSHASQTSPVQWLWLVAVSVLLCTIHTPSSETGAVLLPRVSVAHGHAEAYITHKVARGLSYVPSHGYLLIGFMVKQKWSKLAVMRWKNRGDRTYHDVVARRWDLLVGPSPLHLVS